jgi:SRSO17 transposase
MGKEKCVRIIEAKEANTLEHLWLYARQMQDGEIRYSISNASEDTPLTKFTELANMRWPIKQCVEECKDDLGLDHFEGRSWQGWRRHVLIVLIIRSFLQLTRKKYSLKYDDLSPKGEVVL